MKYLSFFIIVLFMLVCYPGKSQSPTDYFNKFEFWNFDPMDLKLQKTKKLIVYLKFFIKKIKYSRLSCH